ncbi:MAG: RHS domain-containing protein, partial [Reinekea sp.]
IKRGQNQTLVQQLKYNAKHQLIELTETHHSQFKQKLIFQYDALGRRIWKKVYTQENADTEDYHHAEEYLWQGDRRVQTRYFNDQHWCINDEITIYQPGTHKPLAIIDQALGILDIETDHLGTPKALYDHETGREIWSTEHEVYGKAKNNASLKTHPKTGQAVDPKIRFQEQWEDVETAIFCSGFSEFQIKLYRQPLCRCLESLKIIQPFFSHSHHSHFQVSPFNSVRFSKHACQVVVFLKQPFFKGSQKIKPIIYVFLI